MKTKKQNGISKAKKRFNLALFNLFDFVMSKLDKIKNKKHLRNFLFPFCLFVLLSALPARADYTLDLSMSGGSYYSTLGGNSQIAQSFVPTKTNINRIEVLSPSAGPAQPGTFYICKGVPDPTHYTTLATYAPCSALGSRLITNTALTSTVPNNSWTSYNMLSTGVLIPGNHYYMEFIATGTMSNTALVGVTNCSGSLCPTGQAYSYNSGNNPAVDFYFHTYYDSTQVGAVLTVTSPLPGAVVTSSSTINFIGNVQNGTGLQIMAGPPNSSPAIDLFSVEFESNGTYQYQFIKTLPNGEYWLTYYVTKGTSTNVATSTLYVEQNKGALRRSIAMDEATICAGIDKTTFFGGIECGFKKVIAWAIYPSDEMTTDLQVSYDNFKGAFPFNVFYQLTDTVESSMASTTLNMSGTFDVPMINKSKQIITIPVVSSSSMARAIGQTNATLIRNTVTWLMWLAMAFLVFVQFKKF